MTDLKKLLEKRVLKTKDVIEKRELTKKPELPGKIIAPEKQKG